MSLNPIPIDRLLELDSKTDKYGSAQKSGPGRPQSPGHAEPTKEYVSAHIAKSVKSVRPK